MISLKKTFCDKTAAAGYSAGVGGVDLKLGKSLGSKEGSRTRDARCLVKDFLQQTGGIIIGVEMKCKAEI